MTSFFKRLFQKKAPVPKKKRSSLFSTDTDGVEWSNTDWEEMLAKSFQRLPENFKAVNAQGDPVDARIKYRTAAPSIGQYAMDNATAGNVLAIKPILEPMQRLPAAQMAWYACQGFIGYQAMAMIAQHWLVDKACSMPARDAMRNGYEITSDDETEVDPKVIAALKRCDKDMKIAASLREFITFNRIFGIRIAMPIIDHSDPNYYINPFDIEKVKPGSYKGIAQIDPYWITPELDFESTANPASVHFYQPTWWRVNGVRIHRTHLIIITNGEVADVLKPTYYFGGVSIPQKLAERVYAAERTANEAPQLALTKRTTFFKVDVTQALAKLEMFLQKINFFAQMRDNYGVKIGGLEDEFEQFDTSLADFSETMLSQYQLVAAACDVPAAKLMADSPKGGLGSEGGFDADSYYETLESIQANYMQPLLERHHQLCLASYVRPKLGSAVPKDWEPVISWNSVDVPDAKTQAEINEIKSRTGNNLTNGGAIDGEDERNRLMLDKDSGYTGLGDREPEPMNEDAESDNSEPDESK